MLAKEEAIEKREALVEEKREIVLVRDLHKDSTQRYEYRKCRAVRTHWDSAVRPEHMQYM
jgi:hypothetical protein